MIVIYNIHLMTEHENFCVMRGCKGVPLIRGSDMALERRGRITSSHDYTGEATIAAGQREYFFITCTSGTIQVAFGVGGGKIPLAQGGYYEPDIAPCSEITITGIGSYTVHVG